MSDVEKEVKFDVKEFRARRKESVKADEALALKK